MPRHLRPDSCVDIADEVFWPYVEIGEDGCWMWVGEKHHIYDGARVRTVVNFSYLLKHGAIATRGWIKRTCNNRQCINPDHLQQMDENTRRGWYK